MEKLCNSLKLVLISLKLLIITSLVRESNGCSCIQSHPQEHYCSADFIAIVQVKRLSKLSKYDTFDGRVLSYHVKVKKEFKMSQKAAKALSHGLIWTPNSVHGMATCGRKLKYYTKYLITGTVNGEKAWISLCNFVEEVSSLTKKQLKGFRKLYAMGCKCKVRQSSTGAFFYPYNKYIERNGYCNWKTKWEDENDCQALHSMCVPVPHNPQECRWVPSHPYNDCMKRRQQIINKNQFEEQNDLKEP